MEKKMQAKEQEHEIYVKNLKKEIDQLAQHLSEERVTGDAKNKELEEELTKLKKEHTTKIDMKQQELN